MDTDEASQTLDRAKQLSGSARQSTRWFARYLLIFAIGSFAMALGFAIVGPRWGVVIVTPVWVLFVVAISVYANRHKTVVRGAMATNGVMMGIWGLVWLGTVLGSFEFDQQLWWWVIGGVALAIPPLVARHHVLRRTAAL